MAEFAIHDGVAAIPAMDWNRCLPGFLEKHDCLVAIERAGLDGFGCHAVTAWGNGRMLACATAFVTRYDIGTTLDARGRRIADGLRRAAPRLVEPRLACLGSPCTETAPIGFDPDLDAAGRADAGAALLAGLGALATRERADIAALKDVTQENATSFGRVLARRFAAMPGLPVASLAVDFATIDDYLSSLSPGTRRDMRRKLRAAGRVEVERTRDLGGSMDAIMRLYAQTRARADLAFETLTPDYFKAMLACDEAFLTLYRHEGRLIAANLLIEAEGTLLDKFFCMDAEAGRPLNLYFLSWFENLRHCLARGLRRYQAGQASYANKLRLGCDLQPTAMYFRHRNPVLHRLLAFAAPRLAGGLPDEAE